MIGWNVGGTGQSAFRCRPRLSAISLQKRCYLFSLQAEVGLREDKIMLIMIGLAAALSQASARTQNEEQIVGYYFVCEAIVSTSGGKLTGRRELNESTKQMINSDFASWSPQAYNGVSVTWSAIHSPAPAKLSAISGIAKIYLRTQRRLPIVGTWAARQAVNPLQTELLLPMVRAADTKFGATSIPIESLVAFVAQAEKLNWKLVDPRPRHDGRQKTYAKGEIDVVGIREGFHAIPRLEEALDTMAASPEQQCVRTPEYYNPYAEI